MIERIVVGIDFSAPSDDAAAQAMRIARATGAEVELVHAQHMVPSTAVEPTFGEEGPALWAWAEERVKLDRDELEQRREVLGRSATRVSKRVVQGSPADALCTAAKEARADLVVVGSHGRSRLEWLLLGSVAEKVVRYCPMPVLVARKPLHVGGYQRILVAVDFDASEDRAVELAQAVARKGSHIELFHCWRLPRGLVDDWGAGQRSMVEEIREHARAETADKLRDMLLKHRSRRDVTMSFEQTEAPARQGIRGRLNGGEFDLVVVGSRGRRGLRRALLGSVAESIVRHAGCSVAVARGPTSG